MKTIEEVVRETGLNKEEVNLCHSKLYREGMARPGKGYFLINDVCREFAEKGGYIVPGDKIVQQNIFHVSDNVGQIAIGDNANFGDNKSKINPESAQGIIIAKSGIRWAKIAIIVTVALTIIGWILSYYRIWPFR